MAIDLNTTNGIDQTLPKYQKLLNNLQSNILKSHNRKNVRLVFLKFLSNNAGIRSWIKNLEITSAMDQKKSSDKLKQEEKNGQQKSDGGLILNFYL